MKFKINKKLNIHPKRKVLAGGLFSVIATFFKRVVKSVKLMTLVEKRIVYLLLLVFLFLLTIKGNEFYISITKPIPNFGGTYQEIVYGDINYLNPIMSSTDAEKSVSDLIFSSLISFDNKGNAVPDVAEKWEVSSDGKEYKFYLRDDVYFHDGSKLNASDVVFTIKTIQTPSIKSPYFDAWKDIKVSSPNEKTVIFSLPKPYGPFIYNCNIKIIPSYLSADEFLKKNIGSGPYKFLDATKVNNKITSIEMESNPEYFQGRPYINNIKIFLYDDQEKARQAYLSNEGIDGLSGIELDSDDVIDLSFPTSKRLVLIPNLKNKNLKSKDFRKKIFSDEKNKEEIDITLTTIDSSLQKEKAEEIKEEYKDRNINVTINIVSQIKMQEILAKKDYQLLLYGYDFRYDRDPYIFWHSSQVNNLNFSGYSDKDSDILLEDARMVIDKTKRNQKYDEFYKIIKNEYLAVFYNPVEYNFVVKDNKIKGIDKGTEGISVYSRFSYINKWYIKEKRVKK